MRIVVQKFGGTSVADSQKILAAAQRAIATQQDGYQVVVVVSAMGKTTDALLELARQVHPKPPARETDMLLSTGEQASAALMAMAIDWLGHRAVSLTGGQIGIRTDSIHTKARIQSISTARMRRLLREGNIVIAAGFQGIDEQLNITTLGRGGSDTSAVALAAVLRAKRCEIYTDVDGVYTTDPRLVTAARLVPVISYDEMLELASLGAGVMHNRSIEFAKKFDVPVLVRGSQSQSRGTLITRQTADQCPAVRGAALIIDEARLSIAGLPEGAGAPMELLAQIAARQIPVDMIVQNTAARRDPVFSFTVPQSELDDALATIEPVLQSLGASVVNCDSQVSKVSIVGAGMSQQTGVATQLFCALAEIGVDVQLITTSEIKISVLVQRQRAGAALERVHRMFELERPLAEAAPEPAKSSKLPVDLVDVVNRLRRSGMESLVIQDISADRTQGRITISGVPVIGSQAAKIFQRLSADGVFVDMIIQSYATGETADISFTVPRQQVETARLIIEQYCRELSCREVSVNPAIAKLSVSGIGLRSHAEVAIGMLRALASADISFEMMNTSEVRVNIVVDDQQGPSGLTVLKESFANSLTVPAVALTP